jgi:hypothetical protein
MGERWSLKLSTLADFTRTLFRENGASSPARVPLPCVIFGNLADDVDAHMPA